MIPPPRNVVFPLPKKNRVQVTAPTAAPTAGRRIITKKANPAKPKVFRKPVTKKANRTHTSNKDISNSGLANRLIGGNHTMLRAVVPRQNLELGICKPTPRSIFTFLKNCVIAGHLEESKHLEILELFAKVQGAILRRPGHAWSLDRLYIQLATCSAFEEHGIQRMVNIMNNVLSLISK